MLSSPLHKYLSSVLTRRDDFARYGSHGDKMIVAVTAIGVVVSFTLFIMSIFAVMRSGAHRLPFFVLTSSALVYLMDHAMEIASVVDSYKVDSYNDVDRSNYISLSVAKEVFSSMVDILALATTSLILWDRRTFLTLAHPAERPSRVERWSSVVLLGLLSFLLLTKEVYRASYDATIYSFPGVEQRRTYFGMSHMYTAVYLATILNITITALRLRSKVLRTANRPGDAPLNFLISFVIPLWTLHYIYYLFQDIYYAVFIMSQPIHLEVYYATVPLVTTIEHHTFLALILGLLATLGIRRMLDLNAFGDGGNSGGVACYPLLQPTGHHQAAEVQHAKGSQLPPPYIEEDGARYQDVQVHRSQ